MSLRRRWELRKAIREVEIKSLLSDDPYDN